MVRPKSDLSAITVPKEVDAAVSAESHAHTRTLSLRLTEAQYRALLRLASIEQEREVRRVSNQSIIERALVEHLRAHGVLR